MKSGTRDSGRGAREKHNDPDRHSGVIDALPSFEPGLRRQDAGANIGEADGPEGEPRMRRVIQIQQSFAVFHFMSRSILAVALFTISAISFAAVDPNIRAVQPDHINDYWVMTNTSLNVDVPNSGVNLDKPTCSAVTYMIGSDGVTRDIVVRKTVPAGDLETVARSAVKDMHYVPGAKNALRQPVFTYIIIPFNLPTDPAARKQITDACVLEDFPEGFR
jgi:hypothetical protein